MLSPERAYQVKVMATRYIAIDPGATWIESLLNVIVTLFFMFNPI